MGRSDIPTSPGGPLRRRLEKRQLERLAAVTEREVPPTAARAHVRVIEDQAAGKDSDLKKQDPEAATEPPIDNRPGPFHVRPVPIDEPLGKT
jgi:hypothetical protein